MVEVLLVRGAAGLAAQPRNIIVKELKIAPVFLPDVVQEALVQDHLIKTHTVAFRVGMQLADGLRLLTGPAELAGERDGMGVVELHAFFVTNAPVPFLRLPREQCHAGRDATGASQNTRAESGRPWLPAHSGVVFERRGALGSEAVAAPFVDADEDDVGLVHSILSVEASGTGVMWATLNVPERPVLKGGMRWRHGPTLLTRVWSCLASARQTL